MGRVREVGESARCMGMGRRVSSFASKAFGRLKNGSASKH